MRMKFVNNSKNFFLDNKLIILANNYSRLTQNEFQTNTPLLSYIHATVRELNNPKHAKAY